MPDPTQDQNASNAPKHEPPEAAASLELIVTLGAVDFDFVQMVEVDVEYEDPGPAAAVVKRTVVLDKGHRSEMIIAPLSAPLRKPVRVWPRFVFEGQVLRGEEILVDPSPRKSQVFVDSPFVDLLSVVFVPVCNWGEVSEVHVAFEYDDGAGYIRRAQRLLEKSGVNFLRVPLRNPARRGYRYRTLALYDGTEVESEWQSAEGDAVIPIVVPRRPVFDVVVTSAAVDFKTTPLVTVELTRPGALSRTFIFGDVSTQVWAMPLRPGEIAEYTMTATYSVHPGIRGARTWRLPPAQSTSGAVVIPPLVTRTLMFNASLVDFGVAPVVTVEVHYRDGDEESDVSWQVMFTKETSPVREDRFPIKRSGPRSISYQIVYHLNDRTIAAPPVETESTVIVVPPPPSA